MDLFEVFRRDAFTCSFILCSGHSPGFFDELANWTTLATLLTFLFGALVVLYIAQHLVAMVLSIGK